MGNIFTECRTCSVVVDQCELCNGVLSRRSPGRGTSPRGGSGASGSPGRNGGPDEVDGGNPWGTGREGGGQYQPSNMSEADLIRMAQERSLQQRGPGQPPALSGDGASFSNNGARQRLVEDGTDPAILSAAILASHASMPPGFQGAPAQRLSEAEMMAQAIRSSKLEEEAKSRARLREEQCSEYEESLRVDRERELQRQEKEREEEQQRKEAEEVEAKVQQEVDNKLREEEEVKMKAEEEQKALLARITALIEEARARLLDEPQKEEAGRVTVLIRTPEGKALKRAFRGTDPVSQLYDYATVEGGEALAAEQFRLIATMPRSVYEDREATLESVGLQGQCALLVEIIEPSEAVAGE